MLFVVTGASSGIGYAVARSIAMFGNNVLAVGRDIARLEALREHDVKRLQIYRADLSIVAEREAVVAHVKSSGKLAGIVHAAGSRIPPTQYQNLSTDALVADSCWWSYFVC